MISKKAIKVAAEQFRKEAIARPHVVDDVTSTYTDVKAGNKLLEFEERAARRIIEAYSEARYVIVDKE